MRGRRRYAAWVAATAEEGTALHGEMVSAAVGQSALALQGTAFVHLPETVLLESAPERRLEPVHARQACEEQACEMQVCEMQVCEWAFALECE